jgi:uncharacterized protein YggE
MRYLLLLVVAAGLVTATNAALVLAAGPEIMTTGVGIVTVQPDYASVFLWIRSTEKSATESTRKAAIAYQEIVQRLGDIGVAPSDVVTQQFSVGQEWKRDEDGRAKEFIGYTTSHQLKIRVRDRDKVGQVIDESVAGGARSIEKIEFASTQADSAQQAALAEAVRDAGQRAQIMAAAAGGRLGSLIEVMTEDAVRARGGALGLDPSRYTRTDPFCGGEAVAATSLVAGLVSQRAVVLGRWQLISPE